MTEDPIQRRLHVVNHESGHAVAMWLLDVPIKEIDCDRPDTGFDGWVIADVDAMMPTVPTEYQGSTAAMFDWSAAQMARVRRIGATYLRAGAYFSCQDWDGPDCASDRAKVTACRPPYLPDEDLWEMIVESMCKDLEADPRAKPAHRGLARYLSAHFHEVVLGDIAAEVMAAAVLEQLAMDREFAEITAGEK